MPVAIVHHLGLLMEAPPSPAALVHPPLGTHPVMEVVIGVVEEEEEEVVVEVGTEVVEEAVAATEVVVEAGEGAVAAEVVGEEVVGIRVIHLQFQRRRLS